MDYFIISKTEIDSTSDEAKRLIQQGSGEGTVVVAGSQSKGRGKPGSSWFSPPGVGIYLSAIVKPYKNPKDLVPLTLLAARAVQNTLDLKSEIKLPNDILINGKKVCGILVERVVSGHLIIGIGLNVNTAKEDFPDELKDSATSLKIESGREYDLEKLLGDILSSLDREYLAYLTKV